MLILSPQIHNIFKKTVYNITIEKDVITLKIGKFGMRLQKKNEKPADDRPKKKKSRIGRVLIFILNAFLTCVLVGIITGIIVGCTFAVYVKNNIVLEIDIEKYDLNITSTTTTTTLYYDDYTDRTAREGTAKESGDPRRGEQYLRSLRADPSDFARCVYCHRGPSIYGP